MMVVPKYFDDQRIQKPRKKPQHLRRVWKVKEMWELHHRIAQLVALGMKGVDIAKQLNIREETVSLVKNSPVVERHIDMLKGAMTADTVDLGIRIQQIAPAALDLLENVIRGNGEGKDASIALRTRIAEKHMDRAGYSAVHKVASVSTHLTSEDIENIKQRAKDSGIIVMQEEKEDGT